MSSFGSSGSADRRGIGERGGDVEQAEAGRVVPARRPDVDGGAAHHLEQLRRVELRAHRPDPGAGAGDERRREARPVARLASPCRSPSRSGCRRPAPRGRRSASGSRSRATAFDRSLAPTVSTCGMLGRVPERVAGVAVVARRGDDERALRGPPCRPPARSRAPSRSEPRLRLTTPGPAFAAARMPCTISPVSSCVPVALGRHPTSGAAPPGRSRRCRRRSRARATSDADGRAVLAADPGGLLRVERLRVLPAEKLRVGDVDARVDDRDRPSRPAAA